MDPMDSYIKSKIKGFTVQHKPPTNSRDRLLNAASRPTHQFAPRFSFHSGYKYQVDTSLPLNWPGNLAGITNGFFIKTGALGTHPLL